MLTVLLLAAAASAIAQPLPDVTGPAGKGKDTVELICSFCHPPSYVFDHAKTPAEWRQLVGEMLFDEPVADVEKDEIVAYLAAAFPRKVNVNTAPAADLSAVLALTPQQAAALVAHRASEGAFRTLNDVKKVPGIDAAKLEAAKALVEF